MINGKYLIKQGWTAGPSIGLALQAADIQLNQNGIDQLTVQQSLAQLHYDPDQFVSHPVWGDTAVALKQERFVPQKIEIRAEKAPLSVWGRELIDPMSFEQINNAASLPVTLRVALMPDAHVGYGLPIGGVAALEGAIAPYMVGVDIGCRMHATIFDRNPIHLQQDTRGYVGYLQDHTFFGRTTPRKNQRAEHEILDDPRWQQLPRALRQLKDKAAVQLGTSGGGNHFAEWTKLTVAADNPMRLDAGKYVALVTHSGSRGFGYGVANYYSQMAERICSFLPQELIKLAYLDHQSGEGQEYEMAMNLAGDYAKANHEVIHQRIREDLGRDVVVGELQNHHNFAWRIEQTEGPPIFVHRKGATPAQAGVLGIIPGSMATPGFFVEGLGDTPDKILENKSLNSAAHGSGRVLGRREAQRRLKKQEVRSMLKKRGVTLIGGGLDEAPDAYKDSRKVIAAQSDLVRVWAEFEPVVVRMESPKGGGISGRQ